MRKAWLIGYVLFGSLAVPFGFLALGLGYACAYCHDKSLPPLELKR